LNPRQGRSLILTLSQTAAQLTVDAGPGIPMGDLYRPLAAPQP
jgi:hypothetical protein